MLFDIFTIKSFNIIAITVFITNSCTPQKNLIDRFPITQSRMPLVYKISKRFKTRSKMKILIGLPLTFETLTLINGMRKSFSNITVIPQSSGPNSSLQQGVFRYLKKWKIKYYSEASEESRIKALSDFPNIIIDCSFMLGEVALKNNLFNKDTVLIEDTKTGENRMLKLSKKYFSVFNRYLILDNSFYKRNFENKIGIGYSVIGSLMSLGFFLPFYRIGIVGYGYVGSGVAEYARRLGAKEVIITDIDNKRTKKAKDRNFKSLSLSELIKRSDIIITATGKEEVIKRNDLVNQSKKKILVNAGGETEWNRDKVFDFKRCEKIHEDILSCKVEKSPIWEIAGGNSINLVRQIAMTEFLDITFANLLNVVQIIVTKKNIPEGRLNIENFETDEFRELFYNTYKELIPKSQTKILS